MLKINECFYHLQGKDLFVHKNHSHNEIEFIHVIKGNGTVLKNDKTYVLQSQHMYIIDARNAHVVFPQPEDCNNYIRNKIVIEADGFIDFFSEIGMGDILDKLFNSEPISTAVNPEIDDIYKTVYALYVTKSKEGIAFAHGYITQLIYWFYSNSKTKSKQEAKDHLQRM